MEFHKISGMGGRRRCIYLFIVRLLVSEKPDFLTRKRELNLLLIIHLTVVKVLNIIFDLNVTGMKKITR